MKDILGALFLTLVVVLLIAIGIGLVLNQTMGI